MIRGYLFIVTLQSRNTLCIAGGLPVSSGFKSQPGENGKTRGLILQCLHHVQTSVPVQSGPVVLPFQASGFPHPLGTGVIAQGAGQPRTRPIMTTLRQRKGLSQHRLGCYLTHFSPAGPDWAPTEVSGRIAFGSNGSRIKPPGKGIRKPAVRQQL